MDKLQVKLNDRFCYECLQIFPDFSSFKHHNHVVKSKSKFLINENEKDPQKGKIKTLNKNVLQPSTSVNLAEYRDYIHCCKCFATFYTLLDLIEHFDKCDCKITRQTGKTGDEEDVNFTDFKLNQNQGGKYYEDKETNNTNCDSPSSTISTVKQEEEDEESPVKIENPSSDSSIHDDFDLSYPGSNNNENEDGSIKRSNDDNPSDADSIISSPDSVNDENDSDSTSNSVQEEFKEKIKRSPKKKGRGHHHPPCKQCTANLRIEGGRNFEVIHNGSRHHHLCPLCPFKADRHFKIDSHIHSVHPEKVAQFLPDDLGFKCPEESCSQLTFLNATLLRKHVQKDHSPELPGNHSLVCSECGKTLKSRYSLQLHLRLHQSYKSYKCKNADCDASFISRTYLQQHERSHDPNLQLKCTFEGCSATFVKKQKLTEHINSVHLSITPYKCPEPGCDLSFTTPAAKHSHMYVHKKAKFKCEAAGCGKAFKNPQAKLPFPDMHYGWK